MTIRVLAFGELDARTAYDAWRLRQDVFVVEQACPYPDLDGRDHEPGSLHVVLSGPDGAVAGYLRVLDTAAEQGPVRIGRVVLAATARGQGHADALLETALAETAGRDAVLDAQSPLAPWYARFGFEVDGAEFLKDGIARLPMRRPATPPPG